MVSEEDLEQLVAKRLKERKEIINEAVGALRPELDAMRREISAANHVKRELGGQMKSLAREVRKTNIELLRHASLQSHSGTEAELASIRAELEEGNALIEEFGINELSAEQKRAFPSVLKSFVTSRDQDREDARKENRRQTWIHALSAFGAAIAGAVSAAIALHRS